MRVEANRLHKNENKDLLTKTSTKGRGLKQETGQQGGNG